MDSPLHPMETVEVTPKAPLRNTTGVDKASTPVSLVSISSYPFVKRRSADEFLALPQGSLLLSLRCGAFSERIAPEFVRHA